MKLPQVLYPSVSGRVWAKRLRLESLDGGEYWIDPDTWIKQSDDKELLWFMDYFELKNFGPIEIDGKLWGVTHIQYESKMGYLIADPYCVHRWYWWKPQQINEKGERIPGSERGLYYRGPLWPIGCWRWQNDKNNPWVWSKGYVGGHYD